MAKNNDHYSGLSSLCVHAGEIPNDQGTPHTPIYNTTTFVYDTTKELLEVVEGKKPGNLYTRYGLNPTIISLESKLAQLEGAEAALCFSSGMAAEAALFLALGKKGIICIGDAYGGTLELLDVQLRTLGIPVSLLLGSEMDKLEGLLQEGYNMVFLETPTNPTLEIFDIAEIAALSHKYNALVCVDNTFATPVNQRPLELGADLVLHSATKYLGGHSDITAGMIAGSAELITAIWPWRKNLGQMLAPETAAQLSRSVKSLVLRVTRQNETAGKVAEAMEKHSKIKKVYYPGLSSFKGNALAKQQMSGFGGMLTIEVDGTVEQTMTVADNLSLFRIAPSLGGAESLCTQPVTTTHYGLGEAELKRRGISPSMIRLSVGFEDAGDLIADLDRALSQI
jgi:cystathionine beta-lyase/cystathionine gamma-synthase